VEVRSTLQSAVLSHIGKLDENDFSSLLRSYADLGFRWYEQKAMREAVFLSFERIFQRKFSPKPFVQVIHNFGEVKIPWKLLPVEVSDAVLKGISHFFNAQELSNTLLG
jgi:hypothetical protein